MSDEARRGVFITLEGGEGSGKSTQIALLAERLRMHGRAVVATREPGGSPLAERIRELLLDPAMRPDPVAQVLLFSAARRDHVARLIAPALEAGDIVLCDRFADSTLAYQQAAGDAPAALVEAATAAAVGPHRPDLTLILDLPPAEGLARAAARRSGAGGTDAFEAADLAFHERVRGAYLALAAREPGRCIVVDAAGSPEAVAARIAAIVEARLAALAERRHA